MKRYRRIWRDWLAVSALLLTLAGGRLRAAGVTAETRDWNAARKYFQDASSSFVAAMAEDKFATFVKNYPNSEHYAQAIIYEARSQYVEGTLGAPGKFDSMIELLTAQSAHAGSFADQFLYWTAEAWIKKNNYAAAADIFARLVQETPNSPLRPEALYREAEAQSKLGHWQRVIDQLGRPDGLFQQMAQTNKNDELVVSGTLLLGQAHWEQKDYKSAEKVLVGLATNKLSKKSEWDRLLLLSGVLLADDKAKEALQTTTNLLTVAGDDAALKAKGVMLQGRIHESLGELPEAIRIYETNLSVDLPPEQRREALLRIVDLLLREDQIAEAEGWLNDYLGKYPDEKGTDLELLLLGELRLKEQYQVKGAAKNGLQLAEADFQKLVRQFTNSPYLGRAELNLGWTFLSEGKVAESQASFSNAVTHLGFSEDQAVARFKLADILFEQKNYGAAVTNYWRIIEDYPSVAPVKNGLFEPVLYQIVRANLEQTNVAGATDAMRKILDWFPNGLLGDRSLLSVGQAESPARAREVFSRLIKDFPQSSLLPEVKLAVARTYEKESDWPSAVAQYNAWIKEYPDDPGLPRAEFSLAWSEGKFGNETNALALFTHFVARYQTNALARKDDLPAQAQFWVGDYFWNQGDYQKAELSYKEVFNKWPDSTLAFQARMRAGKAAYARPQEAKTYFTDLASDPKCPPELKAQALFALADVYTDAQLTTNHLNYEEAIRIFSVIATTYTNSPIGPLAQGRRGSCYYTLAGSEAPESARSDYETASKAFQSVMISEYANVTTRSMAEFRLGQTLAQMSALDPTADPKPLLRLALDHWLKIMHGDNLRDGEQPDMTWVRDAGLEAGKLAENLGEWSQAIQIYERLLKAIPSMQNKLGKSIEKARQMQLEKTEGRKDKPAPRI